MYLLINLAILGALIVLIAVILKDIRNRPRPGKQNVDEKTVVQKMKYTENGFKIEEQTVHFRGADGEYKSWVEKFPPSPKNSYNLESTATGQSFSGKVKDWGAAIRNLPLECRSEYKTVCPRAMFTSDDAYQQKLQEIHNSRQPQSTHKPNPNIRD